MTGPSARPYGPVMSVDATRPPAPLLAGGAPPASPGRSTRGAPRRTAPRRRGRPLLLALAVLVALASVAVAIADVVGVDVGALPRSGTVLGPSPDADDASGAPAVDAAAWLVAESDGTVLASSG